MILLDYINSINPSVLNKLSIPKIFCSQQTLHIGNNALNQLCVFNSNLQELCKGKFQSLFDVIDNT